MERDHRTSLSLPNDVNVLLTEAQASSLCRPLVQIMDIPSQASLQIAQQHSVVCPAMNLHTARGGLVHETDPFDPDGTEAEQAVVSR